MLLLVTAFIEAHVALEVITQVMMSLLANVLEV